jgi:hypothetical protein
MGYTLPLNLPGLLSPSVHAVFPCLSLDPLPVCMRGKVSFWLVPPSVCMSTAQVQKCRRPPQSQDMLGQRRHHATGVTWNPSTTWNPPSFRNCLYPTIWPSQLPPESIISCLQVHSTVVSQYGTYKHNYQNK